jgi:Putative phage tail protein
MATVVLTAVGTLLGGPIGGAIGAAIGQGIDQRLLAPKAREGPRIKELDVQTSSYGTQVPAIFGAMRVAGTVIWSTDLIERRAKKGGGKGRAGTINYSYSVSFAVALSSRRLARIGRIWADGNILRGAAGDFKTETQFRFHSGHSDQPLDPLIASAESTGQCPAHRDLAYVVFEDFQLADYGNRIPSLTFEIFEREGKVPIAEILHVTSRGIISGNSTQLLAGYAAQGSNARAAAEPLVKTMSISVWPAGDRIAIKDWSAPTGGIHLDNPAVADGRSVIESPRRTRASKNSAPSSLSIRHYEPERDYQAGVQISRTIGSARGEAQIEFAAAIDAAAAKQLADQQLLQSWRSLNGLEASLPRNAQRVGVGNHIIADGGEQAYRITEIEHQRGTVRVVGAEWSDPVTLNSMADPGRNQAGPDLLVGVTQLILADLPAVTSVDPGKPIIVAAVAGTGAGWRRAAITRRMGDQYVELGGTSGVSTMGKLVGPLKPHSPLLIDRENQPVIRLLHNAMALPTGSGDPLSNDAPAIWLNGEVIRYGSAVKIAERDYRITALLRGCSNTEAGLVHADASEAFLLESDSLFAIDVATDAIGSFANIEAFGLADSDPVQVSLPIIGNAIRPWKPVHGAATKTENGNILLKWIRRDRLPGSWIDGVDLANSEGAGAYIIQLSVAGTLLASWTTAFEMLNIAASEIAALNIASNAVLDFSIAHQGRYAKSDSLIITM